MLLKCLREEVDENGNNVQSYKSESGEEFKIIDYAKDEGNNLNQAELIFEDESSIKLEMSDDGAGGVGITRMSAEDEEGVKDFSFVNSDLIQEGTVQNLEDEAGNTNTVKNFDQLNKEDNSIVEDVTSTIDSEGTMTTEYSEVEEELVLDDLRLDADGDGIVSAEEKAGLAKTEQDVYLESKEEEEVSEDKKEKLSSDASSVDDLTLDKNNDGVVSEQERAGGAAKKAPPPVTENADGKESKEITAKASPEATEEVKSKEETTETKES